MKKEFLLSQASHCFFFRDLNMLSDSENPQHLELHEPVKAGEQ